jgi:hypothetical protein
MVQVEATTRREEAATARHKKGWRRLEQGQRRRRELGRWRRLEQRLRWQGGGGPRGAGEEEDGGVWAQVQPDDAGRRSGQRSGVLLMAGRRGSVVGLGI